MKGKKTSTSQTFTGFFPLSLLRQNPVKLTAERIDEDVVAAKTVEGQSFTKNNQKLKKTDPCLCQPMLAAVHRHKLPQTLRLMTQAETVEKCRTP